MKISQDNVAASIHPLIGAEVVFTKHSEKNRNHQHANHWVTFGRVYEVVSYSGDHKHKGWPQIKLDFGGVGDAPMDELDYDIISYPNVKSVFVPVTITLESYEEATGMRDAIGNANLNYSVYSVLYDICQTSEMDTCK